MNKPRTVIKSKRIITPSGVLDGFVIMENGIVVEVSETFSSKESIIDLGDHVLMPGIIDPHVHINEPGRTDWEGFDTATRSALAGGITCLVDMPLNSSPVTTTAAAFEEKLNATTGKLHTNCGFWGGVVPGNSNEIEPLIKKGVLGFKAFLTHSGIDDFPNVEEKDLRIAMPIIAKHGLPLLVHCELTPEHISNLNDRNCYQDYCNSRPQSWEDDAIALMIRLCREFNCHTHIVHLSSASSLEQLAKAKKEGLPLTVETAQHYLYFNAESIPDGNTLYKCAPPIREKNNNEQLWDALQQGLINFVATDHSPAPPEIKKMNPCDLQEAWGGISSLQLALPVLWTAAQKHGATISDMAKWLSEKPASLPGLDKSRGKIAKDYSADFVVWNPEEKFTVTGSMLNHRHKFTPYLHEELSGKVLQTWIAGEKLFDEGKFLHLNRGSLLLRNEPH